MGYGTYTVDATNVGMAFMIKGGTGTCPEWTMFRHDQNRSGYMSTTEFNTQCGIGTGIKENNELGSSVKISPQPFMDRTEISVAGINASDATLTIRDMQGRLVEIKRSTEAKYRENELYWEWNTEKVSPGIYLYQIESGTNYFNGKLVKLK